tara:strand:+ start:575 stop:1951 length:1377 start_codon:yes stop_codon:yes gene_type:complete
MQMFQTKSVFVRPSGGSEYNGLTPDFYISTTGTGTAAGGGTISDPWAITMLNNSTARTRYVGKKIGIKDGTYDLIAIMGQPSGGFDVGVLEIDGGTAGNPTILVSQTRLGAVIDWNRAAQTNTDESASMQPLGDYVTIDGLKFANNNYRCINNYTGGGNFLTVKNCIFTGQSFALVTGSGKNSCMVYTQGHDDILIQNCRFEDGGAPGDGNRHAVIQGYQTTSRLTIEYCSIIAGTATGNLVHYKQGGHLSHVLRYCYLDRSASTNSTSEYVILHDGQTSDATSHWEAYGNIFKSGSSNQGLRIGASFVGVLDLYNNVFIGPWSGSGSGAMVRFELGPPAQFNFYNNIFHRVSGAAGSYGDVNTPSIGLIGTMDYNYFPASSPTVLVNNTTSYTSLSSWQSASSKDAGSTTGSDPLFAATGADAAYYQLQSGSACKTLGAGSTEIGAWAGRSQIGSDF